MRQDPRFKSGDWVLIKRYGWEELYHDGTLMMRLTSDMDREVIDFSSAFRDMAESGELPQRLELEEVSDD